MKFLPRKDVLTKQLKISWAPICLAMLYAGYSYFAQSPSERTALTVINYFAAAFFFLMWLVGQYLRTEKQIDDSANYQDIQAGIEDVKESIRKLHLAKDKSGSTLNVSNPLLLGAHKAIEDGHVLAGLMQAGVAFEQAVIEKARRHGLYRGAKTPTYRAIQSLRSVMPDAAVEDLLGIWKLRNQLAHLNPDAAKEMENQPYLFGYFVWAISELEQ